MSDRIVVMDRGRIAQVGKPEDLYERPASGFIASFIGDANLIDGVVRDGRFGGASLDLTVPGGDGPATVSIRPERIALVSGSGPATIESATYLGSRMEYGVGIGGAALLISRPITEPRLAPGTPVTLSIDPDGVTRLD